MDKRLIHCLNIVFIILVVFWLITTLLFAISFFSAEDLIYKSTGREKEVQKIQDELNTIEYYHELNETCLRENRKPLIDKMIFDLIDAFRADLVPALVKPVKSEPKMPFLEAKMRTHGLGFISIASIPTVTLPRIKAILSGKIPSFIDYILNLSAYKFSDESLVSLAHQAGKQMVFYGDNTWVDVFTREPFLRCNETFSFFAWDYIQVDTNVTYNVMKEINDQKLLSQWDYMFLHYLGVDHIGHTQGGPFSQIMNKKLIEMDHVIKTVYEKVSKLNQTYLIVVLGDHGMTDYGAHGGPTQEEVETALIFLNSKQPIVTSQTRPTHKVLQVDIAPTLALLLGLQIPDQSHGKVIIEVLQGMNMTKHDQICAVFENAIQISKQQQECFAKHKQLLSDSFKLHKNYLEMTLSLPESNEFNLALTSYMNYLSLVQNDLLINEMSNKSSLLLILAFTLSLIPILGLLYFEYQNKHSFLFAPIKSQRRSNHNQIDFGYLFSWFIIILSIGLLGSTSYIEEQPYFWYHITTTWFVYYLFQLCKSLHNLTQLIFKSSIYKSMVIQRQWITIGSCLLVLIVHRIASSWYHAGVAVFKKEIQYDDYGNELVDDNSTNNMIDLSISDWLIRDENKRILSAIVICSLIAISYLMSTKRFGKQQCLLISGLFCVYVYR